MMPIDLKELIIENRSIRTFDESVRFDRETLASFVDCARLSASARNAQTLKFRLVLEKDETEALLALTRWAGDITDRKLPPDGGHPTAFIVICHDKNVSESMNDFSAMDVGIAAQSVTLAAAEAGYGACMIGSFSPEKCASLLGLSENVHPRLLIALGKKAEIVDDYSEMQIVSKDEVSIEDKYPFFSLLNITGCARGITIRDAKYPLDGAEITCEYQYGVSNEVLPGKTAKISVRDGKLLLIKICRQ